MRRAMLDTVGRGEFLEPKTAEAILTQRPLDTAWPERPIRTGHVKEIPTTVAVLPLPRVGIAQTPPEGEAGDFVVEADRVVANAAGMRGREFGMNPRDKFSLRHSLFCSDLRGNAGHADRCRVG